MEKEPEEYQRNVVGAESRKSSKRSSHHSELTPEEELLAKEIEKKKRDMEARRIREETEEAIRKMRLEEKEMMEEMKRREEEMKRREEEERKHKERKIAELREMEELKLKELELNSKIRERRIGSSSIRTATSSARSVDSAEKVREWLFEKSKNPDFIGFSPEERLPGDMADNRDMFLGDKVKENENEKKLEERSENMNWATYQDKSEEHRGNLDWFKSSVCKDFHEEKKDVLSFEEMLKSTSREKEGATQRKTEERRAKEIHGFKPTLTHPRVLTPLPPFSGNVEEWPAWAADYIRSTELYGYSNLENLQRLLKSLTGPAKESVAAMLVLPENVPNIMERLSRRYGRSDVIISKMSASIKGLPTAKEYKPETIVKFSDVVSNLVATVKTLNQPHHLYNPQLLAELTEKLSTALKMDWAKHLFTMYPNVAPGLVGIDVFSEWLSRMADSLQIYCSTATASKSDGGHRHYTMIHDEKTPEKKYNGKKCLFCKQELHPLWKCKQFLEADVDKRWETVKNHKFCFKCLDSRHWSSNCKWRSKCKVEGCTLQHHSLLHNPVSRKEESKQKQQQPETKTDFVGYQNDMARVLLRVLPVTVENEGKRISTFALMDEGSTMTLIDETLAEDLGLNGERKPVKMAWSNGSIQEHKESKSVSVSISGMSGEKFKLNNVRTIPDLNLPSQPIKLHKMKSEWSHLQRVPVEAFCRKPPRILIGQDNVHLLMPLTVFEGPTNAPVASKTRLGWVIHGPNYKNIQRQRVDEDFLLFTHSLTERDELNELVQESFAIDFLDVKQPENKENSRVEQIMKETCRQLEDDHWEIGMLWKEIEPQLPESRQTAVKRLQWVEKKMEQDERLTKQYCRKIEDYAQKGYAKQLKPNEIDSRNKRIWYLPHFPVVNPRKPEKFRFVFDAASKSNGKSLNDNLVKGPNLYNSIVDILFRFRQHKVAFAADIEEMFLRIRIKEEDQDALRFLWRGGDKRAELTEWRMNSMIFGAMCSPTCAMYVLRANAEKYGEENPDAVEAIEKQFYMDDYLDSKPSVQEASTLAKQVIDICANGKFNLRSFLSNSQEFMKSLPEEKWSKKFEALPLSNTLKIERVLGLYWDFNEDKFMFKLEFVKVKKEIMELKEMPTKREALQVIMSVFDPLGFITPLTMKAKMLMQDMWKMSLTWDTKIPQELENKWRRLITELQSVQTLSVPRCITERAAPQTQYHLHVFCDASERGYAAVAYARYKDEEGQISVTMLLARSRVAPIKTQTIPRMELQAAVMAARLANIVKQGHSITFQSTTFWTDSRITWYRIMAEEKRYKLFVANRLKEIKNLTDKKDWLWVPTKENVADEATRDGSTSKLDSMCRWLNGPEFLKKEESMWPKLEEAKINATLDNDELHQKEEILLLTVEEGTPVIDMLRFSQYNRLIRAVAWTDRFIRNCRSKPEERNQGKSLTVQELERAELTCFKLSQQESFPSEWKALQNGKNIPRESRLYKLSTILVNGLIRVKGRTEHAPELTEDTKRPIVLDPNQHLTKLLIHFYHIQAAHQGQETVANNLRQRFWILRLRTAIRKCCTQCGRCQLWKALPKKPEMAPLPTMRLSTPERPFTFVGLDYFGPLNVTIGRRHEKRWGALFTCLSVRAIHLELVSSLDTDSAILAIRRFAARRGYPRRIVSDNGTNFKGAQRELKEALDTFEQDNIRDFCSMAGVEWQFNPPAAPHMGGVWERLVRSVKTSLYAILNSQAPREETLRTVFCEVEYIINNRPLTSISMDPNDPQPLTPNHFLLGGPNRLAPAINLKSDEKHLKKQWRISQALADSFWRRWTREYLPQLNNRVKWIQETNKEQLQPGDVVVIWDGNLPRATWPKGVVTQLYPGKDGKVRVVEVRTSHGVLKRPVTGLVKIVKDN